MVKSSKRAKKKAGSQSSTSKSGSDEDESDSYYSYSSSSSASRKKVPPKAVQLPPHCTEAGNVEPDEPAEPATVLGSEPSQVLQEEAETPAVFPVLVTAQAAPLEEVPPLEGD
eukprot:118328-Amphidinium_carterae.1